MVTLATNCKRDKVSPASQEFFFEIPVICFLLDSTSELGSLWNFQRNFDFMVTYMDGFSVNFIKKSFISLSSFWYCSHCLKNVASSRKRVSFCIFQSRPRGLPINTYLISIGHFHKIRTNINIKSTSHFEKFRKFSLNYSINGSENFATEISGYRAERLDEEREQSAGLRGLG